MQWVKTVSVYTNEKKDTNLSVTERVLKYLEGKCRVVRFNDCAEFEKICADLDALIVLGGDGTLLRVSRKASMHKLPVLGINLGKVGYLAEIETEMIEESLDRFLEGNYKIEERFMIKAVHLRNGKVLGTYNALNDVVVSSSSFKKLVSVDFYVNDSFVAAYDADGVVVATPTGSTAYSLSAGGPITDSSMELVIVTPICAHTLSSRPVIVPPDKKVTIEVKENNNRKSSLTVDGQETVELEAGDKLEITSADIKARFIRVNGMSFYEILRKKLDN